MEEYVTHDLEHYVYVPTTSIMQITARHALGKLVVALAQTPGQPCGVARRIGYTGKTASDLAIYRLKVKLEGHTNFITLPKLFVVDRGNFIEYEEWCRSHDNSI